MIIIPSPLHIALWTTITALGLVAAFLHAAAATWQIAAGIGLGAALLDGILSFRRPDITLKRAVHHNLPVAAWSNVILKISSRESHPLVIQLHDRCDPDFQVQDQPNSFTLDHERCATIRYQVFPTKRGNYTFRGADVFVNSPLHLWQKKWFVPCIDETKVFPNFEEIGHFALLATHHHLSMMGIKKLKRRGEGNEFHQLREYRQGDELQKIDWKATSRYRRLISKDYQDERDQQIIFVLDCGRRMRHTESGRSHLDQALNSILLLAYVASRQGDGVGLYSFGGTEKWLPPRKQEDSVRELLLGMYDIESSTDAADYLRATQDLLALQNRRSLMVIITNSRAEDYDDLLKMAGQLRRKHLVVIADLREKVLDESLLTSITSFTDAVRYQALQHYLAKRKKLIKQLQHLGIYSLDVTAEQLPASLVNRYLEIKSSGSL
jgi:uncharacterized protein (DUF58 family)